MADDFAPWRRFVIAKLRENRNSRIVGVAADGLEAIQKAGELQPDLILLDIRLPKITGIVAARRIRNVAPKSKILFLSYAFDSDVALAALSEDGHGYLVKSDARYELAAAVEAVMQGKKFVSCRLSYPPLARQLKLSGKVRLEVTVSPDGRVKGTRVVGGNPLLADAALEAIRMWRYEVGVKETAEVVEIDFKDPCLSNRNKKPITTRRSEGAQRRLQKNTLPIPAARQKRRR